MKVFLPLTLFLTLFVLAFSEDKCPPPKLIEPCDCILGYDPITYKCSKIMEQDTMEKVMTDSVDWPVDAVITEYSSLNYFPDLRSKNVSTVAIYHSRFTSLFAAPPNKTNVIQNVLCRNVTFTRGLDWKQFENMNLIKIVSLEGVTVKRLGKPFEKNMSPSLEQLTIENAKMLSMSDTVFARLTSLTSLSCAYNSIDTLKRSMFPEQSRLSTLDFSHNKIETMSDDVFLNMNQLRVVYLNVNRIKAFTAAVWERAFPHLQTVDVSDNLIVCDCSVKWYTTKSRSIEVTGTCNTPENLKGWRLIQLSKGDFKYCSK